MKLSAIYSSSQRQDNLLDPCYDVTTTCFVMPLNIQPLFPDISELSRCHPPAVAADWRDDFHQALDFLRSYDGKKTTFLAYRREIERFLLWCWLERQQSYTTLNRMDVEQYMSFAQTPPKTWVSKKHMKRQRDQAPNPDWRPFIANYSSNGRNHSCRLSPKSITAIFAILGSFYQHSVQMNLIHANPISQIKQKNKFIRVHSADNPVRKLSSVQWQYVLDTARARADEDPRAVFILSLLYGLYLRISELVADDTHMPMMTDFSRDEYGNWWFHTIGKGNKRRQIAVSDEVLTALKDYRIANGLSAYPLTGEHEPLIRKLRGPGPITSTRQIRHIVQGCFDAACERLKQDQLDDDARQLQIATVHWLRHTGISEDVKHRPIFHVRDDAGHASINTTNRYITTDSIERHRSGKKKKLSTD